MKSLLDRIAKAYELRQIEITIDKIESLKRDASSFYSLMR